MQTRVQVADASGQTGFPQAAARQPMPPQGQAAPVVPVQSMPLGPQGGGAPGGDTVPNPFGGQPGAGGQPPQGQQPQATPQPQGQPQQAQRAPGLDPNITPLFREGKPLTDGLPAGQQWGFDARTRQQVAIAVPNAADLSARQKGLETAATKNAENAADLGQAPGAPPGTSVVTARKQQENAGNATGNEKDLRTAFENDDVIKNRNNAVAAFNAVADAAGRDTAASDLQMVYGIAKILDPGSVVQAGQTTHIVDTQSLSDTVRGALSKLQGGGRLQPQDRAALLTEARSRLAALDQQAQQRADAYRGIAGRTQGVNPDNVAILPPVRPGGTGPMQYPGQSEKQGTGKGEFGSISTSELARLDTSKMSPAQMQAYEAEMDARLKGGK